MKTFETVMVKVIAFIATLLGAAIFSFLSGTVIWVIWDYVQPVFFPNVPVQFVNPSWIHTVVLTWLIADLGVMWRGKRD